MFVFIFVLCVCARTDLFTGVRPSHADLGKPCLKCICSCVQVTATNCAAGLNGGAMYIAGGSTADLSGLTSFEYVSSCEVVRGCMDLEGLGLVHGCNKMSSHLDSNMHTSICVAMVIVMCSGPDFGLLQTCTQWRRCLCMSLGKRINT
jgi:hypothetical protein